MNEPAMFGHVVDERGARGYRPLIHVTGAHEDTYADVLDRCESHQITINDRYPNVFAFTTVIACSLSTQAVPSYISLAAEN